MITTTVGEKSYSLGDTVQFSQQVCGGCGIPFMMPTDYRNELIQNKGEFWCPRGCNRIFIGETKEERHRKEMEKLRIQKEKEIQALKKQKEETEEYLTNRYLDTISEKKKVERKLKRVERGVCPCCNRSFTNLQRHMQTKHPQEAGKKKIVDPIHLKIQKRGKK